MTFPFLDHSDTHIPINIYLYHSSPTLRVSDTTVALESIHTSFNTDVLPESDVESQSVLVPLDVVSSPAIVSNLNPNYVSSTSNVQYTD